MVPSSVSKMNTLEKDVPFSTTLKPPLPLKITPVGAAVVPAGLPAGAGIVTVSGTFTTVALMVLYSVETPVPLSATHQGVVGPCTNPQEFTRLGSVNWARPERSETRFVCWYGESASALANAAPGNAANKSITRTAKGARIRDRLRVNRKYMN